MKKLFVILFGLVFGFQLSAQRFALVDTDYILAQIPEYGKAQQQLDQLSMQWQQEVEQLRSQAQQMREAYQAEKVLLTEEMQAKQLAEIQKLEEEASKLQRKYFGPEGEVFSKRRELVRPIQDQIYNAVQEVARQRNLDVVFDKGSDLITLYLNERTDISEKVLEELGY